jgi:hypothetical protein
VKAKSFIIRRHIAAIGKIEAARHAINAQHLISEEILAALLTHSPFVPAYLLMTFSRTTRQSARVALRREKPMPSARTHAAWASARIQSTRTMTHDYTRHGTITLFAAHRASRKPSCFMN